LIKTQSTLKLTDSQLLTDWWLFIMKAL
jgi:hypothetical protein